MSCWICVYQQLDNATLLGRCRYFELKNRPAQEIPPQVVDVGCKFKKEKTPNG